MDSLTFVQSLEESNRVLLAKLDQQDGGSASADIRQLLQIALANEISISEIAAAWMPSTREIDVKLALAQQTGDEAQHFTLVERRLNAMGISTASFVPPQGNPLFEYLRSLESTIERVAAGQFTLESIAYQVNEKFMNYCEAAAEHETAKLYQTRIQPDEVHHYHLGKTLLEKYAVTPELQEKAARAAAKTLEIALQTRAMMTQKLGTSCFPGC
jgi:hypothetical protein